MNSSISDLTQVNTDCDFSWSKVISSAALFGKDKSIVIMHDGQRYILRITKLRKLILTK
jgi:hemin uptake protein HemP